MTRILAKVVINSSLFSNISKVLLQNCHQSIVKTGFLIYKLVFAFNSYQQ